MQQIINGLNTLSNTLKSGLADLGNASYNASLVALGTAKNRYDMGRQKKLDERADEAWALETPSRELKQMQDMTALENEKALDMPLRISHVFGNPSEQGLSHILNGDLITATGDAMGAVFNSDTGDYNYKDSGKTVTVRDFKKYSPAVADIIYAKTDPLKVKFGMIDSLQQEIETINDPNQKAAIADKIKTLQTEYQDPAYRQQVYEEQYNALNQIRSQMAVYGGDTKYFDEALKRIEKKLGGDYEDVKRKYDALNAKKKYEQSDNIVTIQTGVNEQGQPVNQKISYEKATDLMKRTESVFYNKALSYDAPVDVAIKILNSQTADQNAKAAAQQYLWTAKALSTFGSDNNTMAVDSKGRPSLNNFYR